MRPATIEKTKAMLAEVLEHGATYAAAGRSYGISRSTVERNVKLLLELVGGGHGIAGLEAEAARCLARLRPVGAKVMEAVRAFEPQIATARSHVVGTAELAAAASRLKCRSENAHRDIALLYVLFCTGAKPVELAGLRVRDYLNADGSVRTISEMPACVSVGGRARPLYFTSPRVQEVVAAYLLERARRGLGIGKAEGFRGLDPGSALFLTEAGDPFAIQRGAGATGTGTSKLMTATLRTMLRRAGWEVLSARLVRRQVAAKLAAKGAADMQLCEVLGVTTARAARRLAEVPPRPVAEMARELI